jgi:hypothetical protein
MPFNFHLKTLYSTTMVSLQNWVLHIARIPGISSLQNLAQWIIFYWIYKFRIETDIWNSNLNQFWLGWLVGWLTCYVASSYWPVPIWVLVLICALRLDPTVRRRGREMGLTGGEVFWRGGLAGQRRGSLMVLEVFGGVNGVQRGSARSTAWSSSTKASWSCAGWWLEIEGGSGYGLLVNLLRENQRGWFGVKHTLERRRPDPEIGARTHWFNC